MPVGLVSAPGASPLAEVDPARACGRTGVPGGSRGTGGVGGLDRHLRGPGSAPVAVGRGAGARPGPVDR